VSAFEVKCETLHGRSVVAGPFSGRSGRLLPRGGGDGTSAEMAETGEFRHEGQRIEYDSWGEGEQVLILIHGLLMNRRMFERLAPALAESGNRVICVDLLGHGGSDRPEDLRLYSMPLFARQVVALLDHLGLDSAVVGGTSLGANVALELATGNPERVRGLFIEMPVLDNALAAVAAIFAPVLLGLRLGRPAFEVVSRFTSAIPRTHYLIDIALD
jgi:pimeloyl-ACP methyl ester carboxylesterase